MPERRYDVAGQLMAQAIDDSARDGLPVAAALRAAAERRGRLLGQRILTALPRGRSRERLLDATSRALAELGYEPTRRGAALELRNCPFHLLAQEQVARFTGAAGTVTGVQLGDGEVVPADLVLVGVGITPDVQLARDAGLAVGNGISVDEHLRTSHPDVYAAGDVAATWHPELGERLRVEHWANARRQGAVAARAMLGQPATGRPRLRRGSRHPPGHLRRAGP
ncbi:FAD-dependent oxidoreductase [Friedmanniella luteola]|uniref:FAD-dependent oxidoreductase n=1 Tax=Friedmanniella luteola TaxID=546871 RepID=UPI000ABAC624|nr:FAD-dependent oxidoreductase [Friedmanniella luteola]